MSSKNPTMDRYAEIGVLAESARRLINRALLPAIVILGVETMVLMFMGHPAAKAFGLISAGSLLVLSVWASAGEGLPIIPMLGFQTLVIYALPIVNNNETVINYSEDYLNQSGAEVLIFCAAMAGMWKMGMQAFSPSSPLCYALQGFDEEKMTKISRLGTGLMISASIFELLQSLNLVDFILNMLPTGSASIVNVLLGAVSACGFFLTSMLVGKGVASATTRLLFWVLLALHCFISASGFLLSSTITVIFSVLIGLFWGGGRVPWKFVVVVFSIISFLNLGKFTMRETYWSMNGGDASVTFRLVEMPAIYMEWAEASFDAIQASNAPKNWDTLSQGKKPKTGQGVFERINNLQNLLFVIDAEDAGHIKPLGGETYAMIPSLLVPRILWPDKPRTHEGQVLLNVHFGRQDRNATIQTYIAWGLLPEAYGNFGPVVGAVLVGGALGLIFAWVERYTARKVLLSMEGFLSFTLFLGMSNSFEMVSTVLVTSIFQAFVPIILASRPFTEQMVPKRTEAA